MQPQQPYPQNGQQGYPVNGVPNQGQPYQQGGHQYTPYPQAGPGGRPYPPQQSPQSGPGRPGPQQNPAQQQKAQPQQPRPKNTTQNSLLFSEIRDNMLIMADGSFRAVIVCKSINFDLMSSSEREAVEFSYQSFINSLTHPIQILIRSQKIDIGPYLDRLIAIRKSQDNMLLGVLMDDYIEFIDIVSEEANIMDKSFYVVIPYSVVLQKCLAVAEQQSPELIK